MKRVILSDAAWIKLGRESRAIHDHLGAYGVILWIRKPTTTKATNSIIRLKNGWSRLRRDLDDLLVYDRGVDTRTLRDGTLVSKVFYDKGDEAPLAIPKMGDFRNPHGLGPLHALSRRIVYYTQDLMKRQIVKRLPITKRPDMALPQSLLQDARTIDSHLSSLKRPGVIALLGLLKRRNYQKDMRLMIAQYIYFEV